MERRSLMTGGNAGLSENQREPYTENYRLTNLNGSRKIKKSKNDTKTTKQVIYMLVSIVFLFAICWGPLLINDVLSAYGVFKTFKVGLERYLYTTFTLMAYMNR